MCEPSVHFFYDTLVARLKQPEKVHPIDQNRVRPVVILFLILCASCSLWGRGEEVVAFTENEGQFPEEVSYAYQSHDFQSYVIGNGMAYVFAEKGKSADEKRVHRIDWELVDGNPHPEIIEERPLGHYANYIIPGGKEVYNVHHYRKLTFKEVYPGIDMVLYGRSGDMKYDFVLAPGADPSLIRMRWTGTDELDLTDGILTVGTEFGELKEAIPLCYQPGAGEVSGAFTLVGNEVQLAVDQYDPTLPLVIDPTREWATYFGRLTEEQGFGGISTDLSGNSVVQGAVFNINLPPGPGPGPTPSNFDVFVAKFDSVGDTIWVTYLGGSWDELPEGGIAVDASASIIIHGSTFSPDFPWSPGAYQSFIVGRFDAYVAKLDNSGQLLWATGYGGTADEIGNGGLVVDPQKNIYIHGRTASNNFPVSGNPLQNMRAGSSDAYLVKLNSLGFPVWSTYYGGTGVEEAGGLAIAPNGDLILLGTTASNDFPVTGSATQSNNAGGSDMYLARFTAQGDTVWSTYYGGTQDDHGIGGVGADANGNVFIQGNTQSANFPAFGTGFQPTYGGNSDACVARFSAAGVPQWATFLGGSGQDVGNHGLAIDPDGNLLLGGFTQSTDFPLTGDAFLSNTFGGDAYLAKLSAAGDTVWTSYYGGTSQELRPDFRPGHGTGTNPLGEITLFGSTVSQDFPTTSGAHQQLASQNGDAFLVRFSFFRIVVTGTDPSCAGQIDGTGTVEIIGAQGTPTIQWSSGEMVNSIQNKPAGTYVVTVTDGSGQVRTDSVTLTTPAPLTNSFVIVDALCPGNPSGSVDATPGGGVPPYVHVWSNGTFSEDVPAITSGTYIAKITDVNGCIRFDTLNVGAGPQPQVQVTNTGSLQFCEGDFAELDAANQNWYSYLWSNGETSAAIQPKVSGGYYVIIADSSDCRDTSNTFNVTVNPLPSPNLGPDTAYCAGDSIELDPGTFLSYSWANGSSDDSQWQGFPGGNWVEVTDANDCKARDTIFVNENPQPIVNIGTDTVLCDGGFVLLDAGPGYANYDWSTGDTSRFQRVTARGTFSVSVTNSAGCTGTSNSVNVFFIPLPTQPQVIFVGGELISTFAPVWQWYVDNIPIPGANGQVHVPTENGTYFVEIDEGTGCPVTSDPINVVLEISDLDIPEGFSPNGDGKNDFFRINNIQFSPDNQLTILNRWGSQVFQMQGYDNTWNGHDQQGKELSDGTYFYVLELNNGQNPITGYIILNR